jgi:hypothetical protein
VASHAALAGQFADARHGVSSLVKFGSNPGKRRA